MNNSFLAVTAICVLAVAAPAEVVLTTVKTVPVLLVGILESVLVKEFILVSRFDSGIFKLDRPGAKSPRPNSPGSINKVLSPAASTSTQPEAGGVLVLLAVVFS